MVLIADITVVQNRYLFVKKKVFNYSELHFSEVTSYKIHTLIVTRSMDYFEGRYLASKL